MSGKCEIIDLSQEIYQGMPVFGGHQKTVYWTHVTHEETKAQLGTFGYRTHNLLISEHGPTHTDAFYEVDPKGMTIDQMPFNHFIGEAICLDVSHVPPKEFIRKKDLESALEKSGLTIKKGDIVLLYTGDYNRHYGTPAYLTDHPGVDRRAAEWLADQGVVNIGIDAPSIDNPVDKDFSGHAVCGERGTITNTEHLANLDRLVNKRFFYIGLALKIRGGTGSPVRAVALVFPD